MKYCSVDNQNTLFLEPSDWKGCGISEDTVVKALARQSNNWLIIKDPDDLRKTLVGYEKLSDRYKEMVKARWGNPYDMIARQPLLKMLTYDLQAEQFYLAYRYNDDQVLPLQRIRQYARAASWLNLLKENNQNKNKIAKSLAITIPEFFTHIATLMESEKVNGKVKGYEGKDQLPGDFPLSYKRLNERLDGYIKEGYSALIDKMYGNQLAAKIKDEVSESKLLSLIEDGRQLDDVAVCMFYNLWAKESDYKFITPSTVTVHRRKNGYQITMNREGNSAFNEKYIRQVKGMRPTSPLYFVEHDDNNLDFLFSDADGYAFHKYVAIVVTDSFCDLVLGKCYVMADRPKAWMVRQAYIDAMYYIRSLTGGWHLPFEIKSDKGAGKSLIPFYESMGKYIPAAHGNKHRGYIEQFFGSPHWKRSQQLVSQGNWSGNNITAKHRGVNQEQLNNNQKNRPQIGHEAETQIENFFHALRHMPAFTRNNMNAPSKEKQWLEAWNQLPIEKRRPITDEQFLLTFGIKHEPQGRTICITNRGVEPQIAGIKYSYDLPEQWMYNDLIGTDVNVYYDPYDMSRVLITNEKDVRFIASTAQLSPRALEDTYTGSRTYLNALLDGKKGQVQKASKSTQVRKELMPENFNAEAFIQGGVLIKDQKNKAEQRAIEQSSIAREKYLNDQYDFEEFFNQTK